MMHDFCWKVFELKNKKCPFSKISFGLQKVKSEKMFNPYFHQTSQSQTVIPPPSLTPVGTRSNKRDDQFVRCFTTYS